MGRFCAEGRLRRARIPIVTTTLSEGVFGVSYRAADQMIVLLSEQLTPVQRRCTVTHEYFHLNLFRGEVFSFHASYASRLQGDRIEAAVHRATAASLVPTGKLRRWLRKGHALDDIAEWLDVTEEVVRDAIEFQLRRRGSFF